MSDALSPRCCHESRVETFRGLAASKWHTLFFGDGAHVRVSVAQKAGAGD